MVFGWLSIDCEITSSKWVWPYEIPVDTKQSSFVTLDAETSVDEVLSQLQRFRQAVLNQIISFFSGWEDPNGEIPYVYIDIKSEPEYAFEEGDGAEEHQKALESRDWKHDAHFRIEKKDCLWGVFSKVDENEHNQIYSGELEHALEIFKYILDSETGKWVAEVPFEIAVSKTKTE